MAADAVVLPVPLVLGLVEEAEPVPLAPPLVELPVVLPLLPEPAALADFNCTLPCASLQCVAADTFEFMFEAPELEDPLDDWADAVSELAATNAVASNIAVNVFMVELPRRIRPPYPSK